MGNISNIHSLFLNDIYEFHLAHFSTFSLRWQSMKAVQMFAEHVVLKHDFEEMMPYFVQLNVVSIIIIFMI